MKQSVKIAYSNLVMMLLEYISIIVMDSISGFQTPYIVVHIIKIIYLCRAIYNTAIIILNTKGDE
jgi:hypothetical protein